jgi:hypothetical protein
VLGLVLAQAALADGTETLGTPSIPLASGSGIVTAGVGTTFSQPGSMNFNVPGTPKQVLLYWVGNFAPYLGPGDSTITVNGNSVTGTSIGGPTPFFYVCCPGPFGVTDIDYQTYRADITNLGLVSSGSNTLTVSDLNFPVPTSVFGAESGNDGVGVIVIYDNGSTSTIAIKDGQDLAFRDFLPPLDTTVPQTFTYAPSSSDRQATLVNLVASVFSVSPLTPRPDALQISFDVGGSTTILDPWTSANGPEWDSSTTPVTIPANSTQMTVQALSQDDGTGNKPASLSWAATALSIPNPPPPCPSTSTSTIVSNFNGTSILAGRTIWFNSVFKPSGLSGTGDTTIRMINGSITFTVGGTTYNLPVPNATVTFSRTATTATTTYDAGTNTWNTVTPVGLPGNTWLTGIPFQVPVNFPGGTNPVTWTGTFLASKPNVNVNWQWAAAVYSQFGNDPTTLGVKPVDANNASAYSNSDHAGTPESFKAYVIGGARGGGGSNFTGSYSGTGSAGGCIS